LSLTTPQPGGTSCPPTPAVRAEIHTVNPTDLLSEIEPMVRGYAKRLARALPPGVADFDDLYQCGMAEGWRLSSRGDFDATRGVKPTTWLYRRVVGAMYDHLREVNPLNRYHLAELKAAGRAVAHH
jgi:DNA-directed RNA polymerase specialized sigma subunit